MNPIFDISDIVLYAQAKRRVAGIPRVQMKIISSLGALPDAQRHQCLFKNPQDNSLYRVDAGALFDQPEFDSARMVARIGAQATDQRPGKHAIKEYLKPYERNKIQRAMKKWQLLWRSRTAPDTLAELGVMMPYVLQPGEALDVEPVSALASDDLLIAMGSIWEFPDIMNFAKQHQQRGGQVIQLIHDVIPYKHPQWSVVVDKFNHFLKQSTQFASSYLAVSDNTRRDLQDFLSEHQVKKPVSVLRLAHEFDGFTRNAHDTQPDQPDLLRLAKVPYVLCVGTIEFRKNGASLIQVWNRLLQLLGPEQTPRLVFAGSRGWRMDEFQHALAQAPAVQRHMEIIEGPSDRDLAFLYQRCLFTSYPSHYEGWGLPVGEAAWFGKYCLTSHRSSLPEVLGPLAAYLDPEDLSDMVEQHRRLIVDHSLVQHGESALRCAPLRSWTDVAKDLQSHINELAGTPTPRSA